MAVLLEVYFYSPDNSVTAGLAVTLEVINVPGDLMIVSPELVDNGVPLRIDVKGPRPLIEQLRNTPYHLTVDYPAERPLFLRPNLDLRQLWLPVGVQVVSVSPNDLNIEFEPIVSKEIPVVSEDFGRPKPGFVVSETRISPPTVRVSGAEQAVASLVEVRAEKINITDLAESREFEVPLAKTKANVRFAASSVRVHVIIEPIAGQSTFEKVGVKLLAAKGFAGTVEPSKVRLNLAGPPELLAQISPGTLELRADARALSEGRFQVRLRGNLPPGVSILSTDPDYVTVQLMKQRGQ